MNCKEKKSYWQRAIHWHEYVLALVKGVGTLILISYLFYGSILAAIFLSPYLFWYMKSWEKQTMQKKQQIFRLEFKEAIQAWSIALNVGYSAENALSEAQKDLDVLYPRDAFIQRELCHMIRQLNMNMPLEQVLKEFAQRTQDEEVQVFVTVFSMAKRSGGDMIGIIKNAVRQIGEKIDVKREIDTMMTAKQLEFRIMSAIPFAMILYIRLSFPNFMNVLYGNVLGGIIMSLSLVVYMAAYIFGKKIVEIEV